MELKSVDINKLSPMMREYVKTKEKYEDILLFYRLGDFYELFFEDAITVSHELELTLTGKNAGLEERVPMCGVPYHAVSVYLDKLIDKGYKIAICEQVEDPKYAKGLVKREVTEIISKGTIINSNSISENDFNFVGSIVDNKYVYSLSVADILSGRVFTTYIKNDEEKLISFIVNLNVKEIVVNSLFDKEILHKLKTNYNIFISIFDEENLSNYKSVTSVLEDEKLKFSTNYLLSYITTNQMKLLSHFQSAEIIDSRMFLELDKECVKNLELVETLRSKERTFSLLWLMDKTRTAMGSRLLKQYIIRPSVDKNEICERHNLVELLNKEFLFKSELSNYLYEVYDLERLVGKVILSNLNGRDLLQLKTSLNMIPNINNVLINLNLEILKTFPNLCSLLEESISLDAPVTIKEGNIIKSGYSSELDELRNIRKNGKDFISKFENEERERTGIKTLKVGYNKVFGYYIEVSKGQISQVKEEFGYIRKQTISNSERYITPLLKEKEDLILNAEDKINSLEYDLFCEIKENVKHYISDIQEVAKKIAYYDVMQSFSTVSEECNMVRPVISDKQEIEIVEGRHPVVERVIKTDYISNDIILKENEDILMITGPNMSGKSTYMRELAIIVILNQIGSFVPAKKAKLPIFDKIFTRIGASDDLVGGESTFMVEMKESANALRNATKNSLILFDELGRGTSTYDGMSLAGSIIEYIVSNIKCKTMFSTHYHELTKMSEYMPSIKNVHVKIIEEDGEIKFLHKVSEGAVDKSYGINVAKLANLPKEVIIKANSFLNEFEGNEKKNKRTKQFELELTYPVNDELREFIKNINPLEVTPLEAINILDQIKKKSEV